MQQHILGYLRKHWRGVLNTVTFAAMALLIVFLWPEIAHTVTNLRNLNFWALPFMLVFQVINYDALTRLYQYVFAHLGHEMKYWQMFRVTTELSFVNHVFPSGGAAAFSFFSLRLKQFGISPGKAALTRLTKLILVFISYQAVIVFGLFALAVTGKANGFMLLVAGSLATLTIVGTAIVIFIAGSKTRIHSFVTFFTRLINRLIHFMRRNHPETINPAKVAALLDDMHENYSLLKNDRQILKTGLLYALVNNITEVLTLYVVYVAFGHWVNIGAIIIAFAIADFAALLSVLPGGVGVYEGLMVAVLATAGVSPGLSIPVTVTYRVLKIAMQLIPGWILYHLALRGGGWHEPRTSTER